MIKIENLSKSYGNKSILKNINLSIDGGQIYGIVGANGAGKTTFFKCLTGIEDYYGSITSSFSSLKNNTGLLLTEPDFLSKLTGREYIVLMCNARNQDYSDLDKKNIFDLPLDEYASHYSTGMKKKLALLAILMQKNEVFLLDEPFNGVDMQSNLILSDIFLKLKELGKILLVSSHIYSSLTNICDQIFLFEEGELSSGFTKSHFSKLESEIKSGFKKDIGILGL
ncbi:ABC transporter ATP-binding protein [Marivirga arenosa]|uniref:ABC transporter ATP-binding protein n=1 Tax=Marivirga arenosa TaxID=3059076 RepID=A0AA51N7P5_9BACT|nr:ABC transporter ATP-binding protein [Marivirga sp. ABR2-2]WMN07195.1 ABC transporter ATP-binding protein [Marivirga sp. ABR2-2]